MQVQEELAALPIPKLSKIFGASQIIATASKANHDYVRSLGADAVIDYNTENVHERVMELTGGLALIIA